MSAPAVPSSSNDRDPVAGPTRPAAPLAVRLGSGLCATLFASLVVVVLWGVISRYVLGSQARWTEELAIGLLIWSSLLAAPLAYREGAHLGVDFIVEKLHSSARHAAAIAVEVIVLLTSAFAFGYGGMKLVTQTWAGGQVTPILGWPAAVLYLAVPLCGLGFVAVGIERLVALARATPAAEDRP